MQKRQRTALQPFEQGVNPLSQRATGKRRKTQPKHRTASQSTLKRDVVLAAAASRRGLTSPLATAPRPLRRSSLFEPEATPAALSDSCGNSILGVDDDTEDENLEGDKEAAAEAAAEEEAPAEAAEAAADEKMPAEAAEASAATAAALELHTALGEDPFGVDPLVHIRWRACFGDMEKNAVATACDFERNRRFGSLDEEEL